MQKIFTPSFIVPLSLAFAALVAIPPLADVAQAQPANAGVAEYPDVPLGDPAYRDLDTISRQISDFFGRSGLTILSNNVRYTRYEFAVAIARLFAQTSYDTDSRLPVEGMRQHPQALEAARRLILQFQPELKKFGVTEEIQSRLREIESTSSAKSQPLKPEPFSDVPRGHWAFAAVERLREVGIVAGFPNRVYHTIVKE